MSYVIKAIVSLATAIAAVVAVASLASTFAEVLGGIVVLVAMAVFARAIMAIAAEPGEERPRSGMPR
jgi:hypothetical protein